MTGVVAGRGGLGNVETIACDLDGVVYVDTIGVPGAGAALDQLVAAGFNLIFVTNNSTKTRKHVMDHIEQRTGFAGPAAVVTSGMATAEQLVGVADRVFVVGGAGLVSTLEAYGREVVIDWRRAEAVVVGLDRDLSYKKLSEATLAIRAGAGFYATNADATYPMPDGLYPGGGAIAAFLERSTDVPAIVCGKPHAPTRAMVRKLAGDGPVLVVGDRPETDVSMGIAEGWATALVLTGVVDDPAEVPPEYRPNLILPSIAELPAALGID
jgi:4-nitrophenyl phosphatase